MEKSNTCKTQSRALEVNIACSQVDVTIDPRYEILLEVMSKYPGAVDGVKTLLTEVCHPYRNWAFIMKGARNYSLNYFHVLKNHPKGPEAARAYIGIFFQAATDAREGDIRIEAADNLLLFLQKIMKEAYENLDRFLPVLQHAFQQIQECDQDVFPLFATSFYELDKLGALLFSSSHPDTPLQSMAELLSRYYRYTYEYWLTQADPLEWFMSEIAKSNNKNILQDIFKDISHDYLEQCLQELEMKCDALREDPHAGMECLLALPGYGKIVTGYHEIPRKLRIAGGDGEQGDAWKLVFLLHIMEIEGLSGIHEEVLRDINRTITRIMEHGKPLQIRDSLKRTFSILENSMEKFPLTALHCVLNMGQGVYRTDDSDLVDFFSEFLVSLGFQAPGLKGIGDDWQVRANPAHIQNIRTWLQLVELHPKWSKKLLSSLIIHLSIGGVFIKDTDLFPRDITRLLNSEIAPVYNLVKQLVRLFPAYFSEIGAEGQLRDISTRIDDICHRKDPLVHFLRKQSHVESSNRVTRLMEAILVFWKTGEKNGLQPFLPPAVYEQVEGKGLYVDGVHKVLAKLLDGQNGDDVSVLLRMSNKEAKKRLSGISGEDEVDRQRVGMAVELYKLLYQKYHLSFMDMERHLSQLQATGLPELRELREALAQRGLRQRISSLLQYLEKLKNIILSPESFEVKEDIYRKRHFTVDIPSMYGSYHEMKFDALGLSLRIESLLNILLGEMVGEIELALITRAAFSRILDSLRLFKRALNLDGIVSLEMERHLELLAHALEIKGFSSTQYLDIFRGFSQALSNIVHDFFNNIHQANILKIVPKYPEGELLPKFSASEAEKDPERTVHRVTEIFLRERIASSLGLQQLDQFLGRILSTLHHQTEMLPKEKLHLLLDYDPKKTMTSIGSSKKVVSDIIHLGNKGLNLVKMKSLGLPVPPGFIITTEVFRCRNIIEEYLPGRRNFEDQLFRMIGELERQTGKSFGDPRNPLLLSVRSGSAISLPGMMHTFVNVGINENIVQGLIKNTGNPWFGWDTYRRFLQSYGMGHGFERDAFDDIIARFKEDLGVPYKREFSGEQMKTIGLEYRSFLEKNGLSMHMSPREQVLVAIRKVFESWYSPKAETYRRIVGISDDWGTAVTVQAMIFGNFSAGAGSGVFFTHNPRWSGDMVVPWGDFTPGNQGEDVVSGLVRTHPISIRQAEAENRQPETSLETLFPEIYHSLREWSKELVYEHRWSPQEMEFTFEGPRKEDLYFLQTRDMGMRERKRESSFKLDRASLPPVLGHGIGVSGGAMSGRVVFSIEEITKWRKAEPETPLILLRNDTVPDDIREIHAADGLLTARGGATSHAAIVAHRLGKTCVVGCSRLNCIEKDRVCIIGEEKLGPGDHISIDGRKGSIYLGEMKIKEREEV
jgi:pyruvate, orthophosphate dikinase